MKKFAILTSILALTACGGGSGGSGAPGGDVIIPPSDAFVPQEDTVAESNAVLTSMVSNSEYQVTLYVSNKLGDDAESVGLGNITGRGANARAPFTPNSSGTMDYDRATELVDMAEWLNRSDTTADDIIAEFNKDRNKIKAALKLMDDMYCFVGGDANETARRILETRESHAFDKPLDDLLDKTEVFNLKDVMFDTVEGGRITRLKFNVNPQTGEVESIEYPDAQEIMDEASQIPNDYTDITIGPIKRDGKTAFFVEPVELPDGTPINARHEYVSYAKELGLRYSDFGVLKTDATQIPGAEEYGIQYTPFAGGYTTKAVETDRMMELAKNGEMTFTGLARGTLNRFYIDEDGNNHEQSLDNNGLRDDNATLVFATDGTQTLSADFDNWYGIQAIKNADGTNQFKIVRGNENVPAKFSVTPGTDTKLPEDMPINTNGGTTNERMRFVVRYYGDNNIPSEATGMVMYQFNPKPLETGDPDGNINLKLGFGVKR